MNDLSDQIIEGIRERVPEGVSFYVVGTDDPALAEQVGPSLARTLQPERRWGRVLLVDRVEFNGEVWEVVVEDKGARL